MRRNIATVSLCLSSLVFSISGCSDGEQTVEAPARPVTFMVIKESNPSRLDRMTGSVESWKKEMLSCRVAGRITSVVEPGINIEGRIFDSDGQVQGEGTLLATLERDRYQVRRDEALARVELTKARVKQAQTELEKTIPERIKEETAERDRRISEFKRQQQLLDQNATSRSDYEEAENWMKQAEAALAQAEIARETKTAELAALNAEVQQAEQNLRQAEIDLADCELFSPFTGQVSKVHSIAGGYLEVGMPIVTVQMMDPVKVELAVSEETDRRLNYDDMLNVFVDDTEDPISGFVYLKDTVADAATRTFNVTVLIRNRKVEIGLPEKYEGEDLHRTDQLFNLEARLADGQPPFYTDESSIHTDEDGKTFVWKVEGLTIPDLAGEFDPVFTVNKVYVELGENTLPILQLYRGRELKSYEGLDPSKDLVTGKLPAGVKDGDQVFLSRKEWMLRPGQLVHVDMKGKSVQPGIYVPRPAILRSDGKHYIFVAEQSEGPLAKARRVEVQVGELIRDFRRIEADPDQLKPGDHLILDGAHYLRDGDPVNAFDEIEVSL